MNAPNLNTPNDWTKRDTFKSHSSEYNDKNGLRFEILEQIDPTTYDFDECGPMYRIRLETNDPDSVIEAWPEEIFRGTDTYVGGELW